MKYIVTVNGERLELEREGDGFVVEGAVIQANLSEIEGTPIRLMKIGDAVYRVVVRGYGGRGVYTLWIDGHLYSVEALDERARAIRDLSAATSLPTGPARLIAPMPGLIVRVKVAIGDSVQIGQGLMVMEAMKMENELRSPAAGTVKAIGAEAGTAVEKGFILVEFE